MNDPYKYVSFLIGIELNFVEENVTIKESDNSVQLVLMLSAAMECHIFVLLKCESIINSTSKFCFILMYSYSYLLLIIMLYEGLH